MRFFSITESWLLSMVHRLIWNLYISGKTSIEHILRSHYRAITDINWHTHDPDIVASTGIDSWVWTWDLRATQKPIAGVARIFLARNTY